MATLTLTTEMRASPERCFDAARDLDLHIESMADSRERAVAGTTSGLIGLGESVTWEATRLGLRQRFTSKITAFDRPVHFQDSMVKGAFKSFVHDHFFECSPNGTVMTDVLVFRSPFGAIGLVVDWVFMSWYLRKLLVARNEAIKAAVERTPA